MDVVLVKGALMEPATIVFRQSQEAGILARISVIHHLAGTLQS